jgi:hypothetical protein
MSSAAGEGAGTAGLSLGSAVGVGFGLEEDLEMVAELLPADCAVARSCSKPRETIATRIKLSIEVNRRDISILLLP